MNEEKELMTNRQLSQLCAKGLCEWRYKEEQKVRNCFEYLCSESDSPVSESIIIRFYEKPPFTDANENEWYLPTKKSYTILLHSDRIRHILGF